MSPHIFRRLVSVADQGGQAFGNLIVTVFLARWLPIEGFAEIATALTVWFFFESLQRTGIIMPYVADVPNPGENRSMHTSWFVVNLVFLLIGTTVLYIFGHVLSGALGAGIRIACLIVPAAGFYFYTRRVLYHENRVTTAFLISLLNVFAMMTVLLLMYLDVIASTAKTAAGLYAGAYLFAGTVGVVVLRSGLSAPSNILKYIKTKRKMITEMSLGAICAYFYNNGIQLLVAAFASAAEAAAFSATRVLVRPLNVISTAFSDIERSAASKAYSTGGDVGLDCFVRRMFLILLGILFPIGAFLIWFTPELMTFLFSDKYAGFEREAQLWILALLPQIIALPLDIRQSVKQQSELLLLARFTGAVASLVTVCLSILFWGDMRAWIGIAAVGVGRFASLCVMHIKN